MSTLSGGPNIITDSSLVLYLDAANNKSYISGSTTWNDVSKVGNNGTLTNGPTFSSANNGSTVFDGVDDYANLGNIINSPTELSVNFWVKNPNGNVIITKGFRVWEIQIKTIKFGGYVGQNNGANYWYGIEDSNNIPHDAVLTQWNNFTYVYDFINRTIKFYTNSVLKGNITVTDMFSTYTPIYNLNIGRRVDNNSLYFSGSLAQTLIYNRALNQSEVTQNFNATRARFGL